MALTRLLVTYDIGGNRRRARVHKMLRRIGNPIQKSVFWLEIDDSELSTLLQGLSEELDTTVDRAHVFRCCQRCLEGTTAMGAPWMEPEDPWWVV